MTLSDIEDAGLQRMSDEAIEDCLASERVGVLGLPTSAAPYVIPISYGYDDGAVYVTFVGGPESQKRRLIETAETASFLVYSVRSMFNWESVVLTGTPEPVPETEWERLEAVLAGVWRPEVFAEAMDRTDVVLYRFRVEDRSGVRHTGLPAGFEA